MNASTDVDEQCAASSSRALLATHRERFDTTGRRGKEQKKLSTTQFSLDTGLV
jgi:hypothetical protein